MNAPERRKPSRYYLIREERQAAPLFTAWMRPLKSWAVVGVLAVFMGIVIGLGVLLGGLDFEPGTQVKHSTYQQQEITPYTEVGYYRPPTLREKYGDEWMEQNKWMWED